MSSKRISQLYVEFSANTDKFIASMSAVSKSVRQVEAVIKPIKARAADVGVGLTAGVTVPLVALGAAAFATALKFDEAMDLIRAKTGATDQALVELGTDFRVVFGQVPNTIKDVSDAIADLNQRTGLSGKPLQDLSTQMLNLSRITKTDIGETIAASTRVFGDWHIATEKQSAALDYMFKVGQRTGIGFSALSRSVQQFGVPLREMGFSFEQSAAMLGQFEKEGVNTDNVMAALRKSLATLGKAGITDASAALNVLIDRIQKAGTVSEANGIAVAAFGAKGGPMLAAAIREGHFAINDLMRDIARSPDTVNRAAEATLSFADKFSILQHKAMLAIEPIGKTMLDAMERLIPTAQRALTAVANLADGFSKLSPGTQDAIIGLAALAAVAGPAISILVKFSSNIIGLAALATSAGLSIGGLTAAVGSLSLLTSGAAFASVADFSAAISLIGGVSAAATGGLVLLAGSIGVGIGLIANWILKVTGLQGSFDRLLKTTADYIPYIGKWLTGQSDIDDASKRSDTAIKALVKTLKERNIAFDESRLIDSTYVAQLGKLVVEQTQSSKATADAKTAQDKYAASLKQSAADQAIMNRLLENDAAKEAARNIKAIVDEVEKESDESKNLIAAIRQLNAEHVSSVVIRDRLGKRIEADVLNWQSEGRAVDTVLQSIATLNHTHEFYLKTLTDFRKDVTDTEFPLTTMAAQLAVLSGQFDRSSIVAAYADKIVELGNKQIDAGHALNEYLQGFYDQALAYKRSLEAAAEYRKMLEGLQDQLRQMTRTPIEVANAFAVLKAQGASNEAIMRIMGTSINEAIQQMREVPGSVDAATAAYLEQLDVLRRSIDMTHNLAQAVLDARDSFAKFQQEPKLLAIALQELNKEGASAQQINELYGSSIARAAAQLRQMPGSIDPATAAIIREADATRKAVESNNQLIESIEKAKDSLIQLRRSPQDTIERIKALSAAGASDAEIIAIMGNEINQAADAARQMKIPLDAQTAAILRQAQVVQQQIQLSEEFRNSWNAALKNVGSDFADTLNGALFEGQKFSTGLKKVFKDLAEAILKAFVIDALGQIAIKLGKMFGFPDLGGSIGKSIGGIFGASGSTGNTSTIAKTVAVPAVSEVSGGSTSGQSASAVNIKSDYAPVFNFYGVPENIQAFVRNSIEPQIIQDLQQNSRGLTAQVISALRNAGSGVVLPSEG